MLVQRRLLVILALLIALVGGGVPHRLETAVAASDVSRRWWSFEPPGDHRPPAVTDEAWPRGEIDRFVAAKLESQGMKPPPPAAKRTLIRRATFDLTGLPPTPQEV